MGVELSIVDIHLLASKPSSNGTNILRHFNILPLLQNLAAQDVFIFCLFAQRCINNVCTFFAYKEALSNTSLLSSCLILFHKQSSCNEVASPASSHHVRAWQTDLLEPFSGTFCSPKGVPCWTQ
jgi:hypothetical protein